MFGRNLGAVIAALTLVLACGQEDFASRRDEGSTGANPPPKAQCLAECDPGKTSEDGVRGDSDGQGGPNASSQNPSGVNGGSLALAFFGGFTSCLDQAPDPDEAEIAAIYRKSLESFGSNAVVFSARVCYASNPAEVHYKVTGTDEVATGSVAEVTRLIADQLAQKTGVRLHLIGHSYGGWTAMNVAQNLPDSIRLGALVTIDPISVRDCTPENFVSGLFGGSAQGCLRAPTDFGSGGVGKIKSRVGSWLNFYQSQVPFLHSSPIEGAANEAKNYASSGVQPHNDFLRDPTVATGIINAIKGQNATN